MKHIHFNKLFFIAFLILFLSSCCKNQINGTFLLTDDEVAFFPDTTIKLIEFVDNYGITEFFELDERIWYNPHHMIERWSEPDKCGDGYVTEIYGVNYYSAVNNFVFTVDIRSYYDGDVMEIQWNNKFYINYKFNSKEISLTYPQISENEYDTTTYYPKVTFLDSLNVRDTVYKDIMLIDLLDIESDVTVPQKIYIAKRLGLVKFDLKNGVVFQRVEN